MLRIEDTDRVRVLTLDRPDALNAFNEALYDATTVALRDAAVDDTIAVVVITGAGRAFSAGADISELDTLQTGADFARFVKGLTDAFDRLAACAKPSIAAINGIALGGGCELALACDLRLAAPNARLGVPEVKLGLLPGAAGTQRLARMLPAAVAKHMLMTGAPLAANAAVGYGLINSIHDDVVAAALELATSLAAGPPKALAAAKELVDAGVEMTLTDGIVFERETVSALFETDDRIEGIAAFMAKRPPTFTGR